MARSVMSRKTLFLSFLAAVSLTSACYPDRLPERRTRVEPTGGDSGEGGMGGVSLGGADSRASGGQDGTGGDVSAPRCVLRVDISAGAGIADGDSWATAFAHPQDALDHIADESLGECELWIAEGQYAIATAGLRIDGAHLLGGFDGSESAADERNPEAYDVILDGDGLGGTVLKLRDATLDGLGVTGGIRGVLVEGGDVELSRVDVFGNAPGGGIVVDLGDLTLTSSRVFQNASEDTSGGGGILAQAGTEVTVEDSIFANNQASGSESAQARRGGALHLLGATNMIRRCIFVGNQSVTRGGAASMASSGWRIEDSVFIGNEAPTAAAVDVSVAGLLMNSTLLKNGGGAAVDGSAKVVNSILWQNTSSFSSNSGVPDAITSIVEGGYSGGTSQDVILSDPVFEGEIFSGTTTSIAPDQRTSMVGHDGAVGQGVVEGLFAEVQGDSGSGFFYIVDNSADAFELLGKWDSALGSQSVAVLDLRLQGTSPAIDRARGSDTHYTVSETDIEGSVRRDVSSVPNLGTGTPTYVDIGAHER